MDAAESIYRLGTHLFIPLFGGLFVQTMRPIGYNNDCLERRSGVTCAAYIFVYVSCLYISYSPWYEGVHRMSSVLVQAEGMHGDIAGE